MAAPANIYPLATSTGIAIPLDVIRPANVVFMDFPNGSEEAMDLPVGTNLIVAYTSKDCMLNFGAAIGAVVEHTAYPLCLFLPANSVVTIQVPEGSTTVNVQGMGAAGRLVIQVIEKWASIGLTTQFTRK